MVFIVAGDKFLAAFCQLSSDFPATFRRLFVSIYLFISFYYLLLSLRE